MNAHVTFPSDRTLLPRGLVGRPAPASFSFEIGELVVFDRNFWVVLGRDHSAMGREHYDIYNPLDEREHRTIARPALNPLPPEVDRPTRRRIASAYLAHLADRATEASHEEFGQTAPPHSTF